MADNPPRPGQILNYVEPRRYPTRHSIRQSGTSLELYDTVLNDIFRKPVTLSTMSVMPDDIAKLGKRLGAMFVRLEPFDGTQNIKDFFQDFERYLNQTATTSDSDKSNSLTDHTKGEAHAFYRTLTPSPNYADLKTALEDRFGLNIQEKRQIKSRFYSNKQLPGELFKMYVGRMQQMARQIEVPDSEVVEVCINGARIELRPHLAMAAPDSVKDLLKLAVVANENLVADSNPQFEALNAVTAQMQQFECRMTALHDSNANRQQPPHNNRPQQRRPRGQQRNNGPRFQQPTWTLPPSGRQSNTGANNGPANNSGPRTPSRSPARQLCGRCRDSRCQGFLCRAWGLTCNKCGGKNHFAKACHTCRVFTGRLLVCFDIQIRNL